MSLANFIQHYSVDQTTGSAGDDFHDAFGRSLPRDLHNLYDQLGFSTLREGMFELIDPRKYASAFAAFFGGDALGRVPFLKNAFGELISYKRLGPREAEISILHTYGPQLEVVAHDFDDFLDRVMLTDDGLRQVLNVSLYNTLRGELGKLRAGQAYGFDPGILREQPAGTKADASYFEVVDALDHLALLLTRAEQE